MFAGLGSGLEGGESGAQMENRLGLWIRVKGAQSWAQAKWAAEAAVTPELTEMFPQRTKESSGERAGGRTWGVVERGKVGGTFPGNYSASSPDIGVRSLCQKLLAVFLF